jgi:hypothetical protein
MTLAVIALAAGLLIGYARGGGLVRLTTLRPVRNRLVLTGVGLYVIGVLFGWMWEPALALFAGLALIVWGFYAWLNRAIHGAALVGVGLAANAVVLLVNGAIPVSADAATRAGADPIAAVSADNHEATDPDTRLAWLGKTIPVAFPPRPEVVSPGDVAVAAGLAVALCMGLTGRRERSGEPERAGSERSGEPELDHGPELDDQLADDEAHETIDIAEHERLGYAPDRPTRTRTIEGASHG